MAVAADLQVQALGERVDDRDADAVQAAGDLVAAAVPELAAGVEDGQHDLGRGALLFLHRLDRDAAAVVGDGAAVVRVQDDADAVAVAGERLVDRVVDDLVDEVMKAARAGRADVHAGTLADRFEALEDGDVLGAVGVGGLAPLAFFSGNESLPVDTENPDAWRLAPRGSGRNASCHKNTSSSPAEEPAQLKQNPCKSWIKCD